MGERMTPEERIARLEAEVKQIWGYLAMTLFLIGGGLIFFIIAYWPK